MADDYLGRKMEEYMARKASGQSNRRPLATLGRLLLKNRSHRGYDTGFVVREDQLRRMIEVNTRIPSARNQQVLRFRPVLADEAHKVLPHIRLGGALPALRLPFPGTEPNAFIIICSTVEENRYVDMDLGISAQSMLLQAYEPLLILAVGKGIEKIELVPIGPSDSHTYYRENGTHYVPKLRAEELTIKE